MVSLALCCIVSAVPALVYAGGKQLGRAAVVWFLFSWLVQGAALPLALLSFSLIFFSQTVLEDAVSAGIWSIATVLYLIVHRKNWRAGKYLVSASERLGGKSPGAKVSWYAGIAPFKRNTKGVVRHRSISYSDQHPRNLLDIFTPAGVEKTQQPRPVLIDIHGGAWITGNRSQQAVPLLNHMTRQGWVCVSISYRLGPQCRFPAMIEDVLKAIAWVKQHIGDYSGDPNFIALSGGSAGGHLTALAALAANDRRFQPGFEHTDTRVQAALPLYGRYDFTDRHQHLGRAGNIVNRFMRNKVMPFDTEDESPWWQLASPIDRVHGDAPPFVIIHGTHDSLIPLEEARDFETCLKEHSDHPHQLIELAGIQHGYDMFNSALTRHHVVALERILNHLYRTHGRKECER